MKKFGRFNDVIKWTAQQIYDYSYEVHTEKWQGKEIKHDPRYTMIETLNLSFSCQMSPKLIKLLSTHQLFKSGQPVHFMNNS